MKKRFLLPLALGFVGMCLSLPIAAQEVEEENKAVESEEVQAEVLGVHPIWMDDELPEKNAHWSISLDAGFNMLQSDLPSLGYATAPLSNWRPFGEIMFQCDFNPIVGIAFGYNYSNFGMQYDNGDWLLLGNMHKGKALLTVDLTDAMAPHRRNTVFNLYAFAGGGAGYYTSTLTEGGVETLSKDVNPSPVVGFVSVGGLMEFNLSRGVALGIKGEYHFNMTDNLDCLAPATSKDNQTYVSLSLRWKLNARHRNHVRNYSMRGIEDMKQQKKEQEQQEKMAQMQGSGLRDTIVVFNNDTIFLSKEHERVIERQKIEINNGGGSSLVQEQKYYCYFASGKDNLDAFALQSIQQVATLLQDDQKLGVAITGYCDNTASQKVNEALSKRRAQKVATELEKSYNIDDSRIVNMGLGILRKDGSGKYGPNRRVEMKIVSISDVASLKQQKDSLEAIYNHSVQQTRPKIGDVKYITNGGIELKQPKIETNDTILERTVETYAPQGHSSRTTGKVMPTSRTTTKTTSNGGILAKVTVDGGTTLVKLAREYYGNGDYWPLIYEANINTIPSPNRLKKGTIVAIPDLTAEQKKMTKAQLQKLAEKYL